MSNKGEVPDPLTRLGLKLTRYGSVPLVGQAVHLLNAANSPAYLEIPYFAAESIDMHGNPTELTLEAEADPDAIFLADYIQRLKKEAVVLAVGRSTLERTLTDTGGRAAVAARIGNVVAAGVFPNGTDDLGRASHWEYNVGMRSGTVNYPVGIGALVWEESGNRFVIPPGAHIIKQHVPVEDFHKQYRRTPLV